MIEKEKRTTIETKVIFFLVLSLKHQLFTAFLFGGSR